MIPCWALRSGKKDKHFFVEDDIRAREYEEQIKKKRKGVEIE